MQMIKVAFPQCSFPEIFIQNLMLCYRLLSMPAKYKKTHCGVLIYTSLLIYIITYRWYGRYDMAAQTPTSSAGTAATATQSKATPGSPRIIQSGGIKQPVKVVSSTAAGATVSSSLYCSAERLILKCCQPISTITFFFNFKKKLPEHCPQSV